MKTVVVTSGKYDPILDGHIDNIYKTAELGDYLIIINHPDNVIARVSSKGFNATTLKYRRFILEGLIMRCGKQGEVFITSDGTGNSIEALKTISKKFKNDKIIYARGGDRTPENMYPPEAKICDELGIEIVYGVGDLLSSSSKTMERILALST